MPGPANCVSLNEFNLNCARKYIEFDGTKSIFLRFGVRTAAPMAETEGKESVPPASQLADALRRIAELEAQQDERSRAQEEMREDQRLYRELFEESLGLMCVHDLDGVLLVVNPAAAQSLGFRADEGAGVNMKRFLAPPVRPLFDAYLERIRRNRAIRA